jgi:hypothetical protein
MAQTIGRVIRLNKEDAKDIADGKIPAGKFELYRKSTGYVTVPCVQESWQEKLSVVLKRSSTPFSSRVNPPLTSVEKLDRGAYTMFSCNQTYENTLCTTILVRCHNDTDAKF